jgi:hypothetical protein
MSAMNQLTQVTQKIAEATAMIAQLQALIPALALAAGAEASATETPAPKVKKAKKVKAAAAAAAASPAEVVETVAAKPKKPASDGTMAWHAFVKNVQETQPTRFTELKKHSEVLHEAKSIREEDEAGYKSFVSAWKAAHLSSEAPLETLEEVVVIAPAAAAAETEPKEKEKRKVAPGTMAWHAFVTHCKATMPELAALSKSSEKLQAIKARKQNDKTGYDSFVAEWKAAQPVA